MEPWVKWVHTDEDGGFWRLRFLGFPDITDDYLRKSRLPWNAIQAKVQSDFGMPLPEQARPSQSR